MGAPSGFSDFALAVLATELASLAPVLAGILEVKSSLAAPAAVFAEHAFGLAVVEVDDALVFFVLVLAAQLFGMGTSGLAEVELGLNGAAVFGEQVLGLAAGEAGLGTSVLSTGFDKVVDALATVGSGVTSSVEAGLVTAVTGCTTFATSALGFVAAASALSALATSTVELAASKRLLDKRVVIAS